MEDILMMECLSNKVEDFILMGNQDAFAGKYKNTKKIFDILKEYYDKDIIVQMLKNYLLGYEVGIIEKQACYNGMIATFDYKTGILEVKDQNDFSLPYDEEYRIIEEKSETEAKRLVKSM